MRKSPATIEQARILRRQKFLGLTMGLLCFDSANQALAHGAMNNSWTPPAVPQHNPLHNHFIGAATAAPSAFSQHLAAGHTTLAPLAGTHGLTSNKHAWHLNNINVQASPLATGAHLGAFTSEAGLSGHSLDLDLSSTTQNIVLGTNLFHGTSSVTINVGGSQQSFSAGSKVTAAQYVAIKEQLGGGGQTITLDAKGAANGGNFATNGIVTSSVKELLIPKDVTAIDYFSSAKTLSISGDLINYGSLYGVSTNSSVKSGTFSAKDITNEVGGVISTVLKDSLGIPDAVSGVSLNLVAQNDVTNHGTVSSAGALTVNAGSGNLTNSGLLSAVQGNVNVSAPKNVDINIAGTGGTMQALAGDINVRNPLYSGAGNINMVGGDYLSSNLNLYSGAGAITGNVGQVSGKLNTAGDAAHFSANTANLLLGSNKLAGDPTFVNSAGDITITGEVTAAEAITIIASGNILASGDAFIHTNNSSAVTIPSTAVTLIAGGNVTTDGNGLASQLPLDGGIGAGNTATVSGRGNGGNIDLTGSTHGGPLIDTSSTLSVNATNQTNGGFVQLIAYSDSATGSVGGQVLLPVTINSITTTSAHGIGGPVSIISDVQPGSGGSTNAISLGGITTGGATAGGTVQINTAQPLGSATYGSNGSVTGSVITAASSITQDARISVGDINTAGAGGAASYGQNGGAGGVAGGITVNGGGNVTVGNLEAYGGGGAGGTGGGFLTGSASTTNNSPTGAGATGGAGGNGAGINVFAANGTVTVDGEVNASGGGGGGGGGGGAITSGANSTGAGGAGGSGGNAGIISISAFGGAVNIVNGVLAVNGGAGGKGGDGNGSASGAASGGGGGASYGGGGGGGGGGFSSAGNGVGGGGGGGVLGGGAGEGGNNFANGAGGGGGSLGGGTGGTGGNSAHDGGVGIFGQGGSINSYGPSGGNGGTAVGLAGAGGASVGSASAGANGLLPVGGKDILVNGDSVTIDSGATGGKVIGNNIGIFANTGSNGSVVLNDDVSGAAVSIASDGSAALDLEGNVTGSKSVSVTTGPGVLLNVNPGKSISAPDVLLEVGGVVNNGSITATTGTLAIDNANGGLAFGGSGTWSAQTALSVSSTGDLDIGGLLSGGGLPISPGASLLLVSSGNITATGGPATFTINTNGSGPVSNAGSVTMLAGVNYTLNGSDVVIDSKNLASATDGGINFNGFGGSAKLTSITAFGINGGTSGAITLISSGTDGIISGVLLDPAGNVSTSGKLQIFTLGNSSQAINVGTVEGNPVDIETGTQSIAGGGGLIQYHNGAPTGTSGTFVNTAGGNGDISIASLNPGNLGEAGPVTVNGQDNVTIGGAAMGAPVIVLNATNGTLAVPNTISSSAISTNGFMSNDGGSITITANQLVPNGAGVPGAPILVAADGSAFIGFKGNGGTINIFTKSDLDIGLGLQLEAKGAGDNAAGGKISVSTTQNLFVDGSQIQVTPGKFGDGGSISLTAGIIQNQNSGSGPITLNAAAGSDNFSAGNGGSVSVTQTGNSVVLGSDDDDFSLQVNSGKQGGNGGSISLTGIELDLGNPTVLNAAVATVVGGGNGGTIRLHAVDDIIWSTQGSAPLVLSASANASSPGNGGVIDIQVGGDSPLTIGSGIGQYELSANSGKSGGNGGSIFFSGGGDVFVKMTVVAKTNPIVPLQFAPLGKFGNGGTVSLTAGTSAFKTANEGNLLVTGAISVAGKTSGKLLGVGGSISLESNNSNTMYISSTSLAKHNGITGALNVSGAVGDDGSLTLRNRGGDISFPVAFSRVGILSMDSGKDLFLGSYGNTNTDAIFIRATGDIGGGSLIGHSVSVVSVTGNIGIGKLTSAGITVSQVAAVKTNTPDLTLQAAKFVYAENDAKTSNLETSFAGAGSDFFLKTTGNLNIAGPVTAGGQLELFNTNTQTITEGSTPYVLTGNNILLYGVLGTSTTNRLQIDTGELVINSTGASFVNDRNTGFISLQAPKVTKGLFFSAVGDIFIDGIVGATTNLQTVIESTAGNINKGSNPAVIAVSGVSVQLKSDLGSIGVSFGPHGGFGPVESTGKNLIIQAPNGTADIDNKLASAVIGGGTQGDLTITATGAVTLSSLATTNGSISVTNATGLLKVNPGCSITATNGSLTLNSNNARTGKIELGVGSKIKTAGATGGDVDIIIVSTSTSNPATAPLNINVVHGPNFNSNTVDFGAKGIIGKISAKTAVPPSAANTVTLNGANVFFNTGTLAATAITLDGGVQIEADPNPNAAPAVLPASLFVIPTPSAAPVQPHQANQQALTVQSVAGTYSAAGLFSPVVPPSVTAQSVNATGAAISNAAVVSSQPNATSNLRSSSAAALDSMWLSDTELTNGEVPAVVISDEAIGIDSDVSTVVDMSVLGAQSMAPHKQTEQKAETNKPLSGNVSMQVGGTKIVELKKGSVLFAPAVDTVVKTPYGDVQIMAKALALVMSCRNGLAVFDLDDQHKNAVVVKSADKQFALHPGSHVLVTSDSAKGFEYVNAAQLIPFRSIVETGIGAGLKAYTAQFSLPHAMRSVQPLKKLVASSNPGAQKVAARMLKTAAIMMQLDGTGGYTQRLKPSLTAYQNQ